MKTLLIWVVAVWVIVWAANAGVGAFMAQATAQKAAAERAMGVD